MPAPALTLSAPAKLNLHLRVVGLRPDGYHELDSVFHTIGLADTVRLEAAPEVRLTCSDPALEGPANLALRAAHALRARAGEGRGVHVRLEKRIPPGAGLGGGSSDAAAVLKGLNRLWGLGLSPEALAEVGAGLGSDVPFFLVGGAARVRGRGERVTALAPLAGTWCLLVHPCVTLSTAEVYRAWDRARAGVGEGAGGPAGKSPVAARGLTPTPDAPIMTRAPDKGAGQAEADLLAAPVNDLEAVACQLAPEIGTALAALRDAGGRDARMTGSGAAVFCLADSRAVLEETRNRLAAAPRWNVWMVPLTAAEGP